MTAVCVNGHTFADKVITDSTCTATGTAHYMCVGCGTVKEVKTIAVKAHSYGGYKSDENGHWKECSCGAKVDSGSHNYRVGGVCATCGYEIKVEVYEPETTTPSTSTTTPSTTPATSTTTTTQTTTNTETTTPETTTTPSEEIAVPVEEVVVDTKIVEEVATEEVKEAVKETVTVAEVKEVEKQTETGTVTVAEVKVAVTTETVDKVIENTEAGATVILPLTEVAGEGQAVTEAEVAVEALEKIVEAESALTVEFEGVKVSFDAETVKAIAEQAKGSVIELRVVPVEYHELNEEQQAVLEAHDVAICVSAQIFSDGEYIGDFKGGKARIAIPFTPEEGRLAEDHKVYYVADDGEMTLMPFTYADGHMVIETTHFSDYVIVYDEVAAVGEGPAEVEDDMAVEEAPAEIVEEEAGLPIVPIIIIVVVVLLL